MYNWSTRTSEFKKNKKEYTVWKLEQLINFGLNKKKINRKELKKYWKSITIDPKKSHYLSFLLWPRKQSSVKSNNKY